MAYTHTTFLQARQQLAALLNDSNNVYWGDAELGIYIVEALRTWGASSLYWRARGVFQTAANVAFYNLPDVLPALMAYTVTDTQLVTEIQYQLLEPATGTSWTGSDQFNLNEVALAIQRRRNEFRVQTGQGTSHSQVVAGPLPLGRIPLSDSIIDVRRAAFQPVGGSWTTLWREDEWAFGANSKMTWPQNPGVPQAYSILAEPPVTFQFYPPPSANGTLDLLTINSGADLNPAVGVSLGIPDNFAWVIKFGALADLLGGDGQARDPARSAYCLQRWKEGIELFKIYTSIVQLQINDAPVYVCSLQELDSGSYSWQNTTGVPNVGALSGYSTLALAGDGSTGSGVPNAIYGVSADVVQNAPVPVADGEFIQVGREELDAILRYAQHIAAFKMGGDEFNATQLHYQDFMQEAAVYNARLKANARNFKPLMDRAQLEKWNRPRKLEQVEA